MPRVMTKVRFFVTGLLLLSGLMLSLNACSAPKEPQSEATPSTSVVTELEGKITVSGAFALYPMMVKWAEEFQKIYPKVRIDVSAGGAGKGVADALGKLADIGMVSRDISPTEIEQGGFYVSVVKDAVVATANSNNPAKERLLSQGLKRQDFINIWIDGKITDWNGIFSTADTSGKTGIHLYTRSDACGAAETWAKYLGKKQEDLLGIGVYGDPGLAEAVAKDRLGIGYNNINYAYDTRTGQQLAGLLVIPIDLNNDGKIAAEENFYSTADNITHAIASGAYPSPPAREENLLTYREFTGVNREFVKWILTDGQKYVSEAGYIQLSPERLATELAKLK